ncbi:MAG TPA: translation initiation factor IF-2 N-terminal domain-containing protein, partial [Acidimicrobiales bacterium]|nr:translation initiation factor IF-2 N-terminal domain-containing protein [Acidimicrobiales bacterium]
MPKKIRVYELARELGLENKEALDLCVALGIGVKSHSSSIEDAQADRVRRKADAEGLRRAVQPEAAPEPKAPRPPSPPPERESAGPPAAPAPRPATPPPGQAPAPTPAPGPESPIPPRPRLVTSRPASEVSPPPAPPRPAAPR